MFSTAPHSIQEKMMENDFRKSVPSGARATMFERWRGTPGESYRVTECRRGTRRGACLPGKCQSHRHLLGSGAGIRCICIAIIGTTVTANHSCRNYHRYHHYPHYHYICYHGPRSSERTIKCDVTGRVAHGARRSRSSRAARRVSTTGRHSTS